MFTENAFIRPNLDSCALLTIDTQCDTLDGAPIEIPGTSAILPNIVKLLDLFRKKNKMIIHIVRIYKKDGSNVDLCRKQDVLNGNGYLLENTPGCELALELKPEKNLKMDFKNLLDGKIQKISETEVMIYKSRWGAFYKTPLDEFLKKYGIDTLVFSGCNFPNCPRTTIYEASERDYKIILIKDAISRIYEIGENELKNIGVQITNTDEFIKIFSYME